MIWSWNKHQHLSCLFWIVCPTTIGVLHAFGFHKEDVFDALAILIAYVFSRIFEPGVTCLLNFNAKIYLVRLYSSCLLWKQKGILFWLLNEYKYIILPQTKATAIIKAILSLSFQSTLVNLRKLEKKSFLWLWLQSRRIN